jgi:alanyl-tRNA synthetase
MLSSSEIRQQFFRFFESKGHIIVPSAPLVLKNDPTLLFTNAGMNQFKDYFLGNKKPKHHRVADTQKCLRVSGKHNDLEEVGVDTYHHTMFEMLGNWSFGDPENPSAGYFKKEAIAWSWELLTEVYKIPKDRLYVTVFEGDAEDNLPKDTEAYDEWCKWIDKDRILFASKKDNFWEMGDTGPCGPCTEIHVDCRSDEERAEIPGKDLVNKDNPQVIEIWNNVFIQFNRLQNGTLELLPARHVDTGMGLERLVRVLQGKHSNYDTDLFIPVIKATEAITGRQYHGKDSREDIAFRVISDHIRAISFAICDGQLPSNTGAGYVIRRILRRAVRYYFSWLHRKSPLLHQLVPTLAEKFEDIFPELKKQQDFISRVIKEEEEAFLKTLDKGMAKIEEIIEQNKSTGKIPGKSAFELYDTYGFPADLTALIARESGMEVDEKGFAEEMEKQKSRSRAAAEVDTGDWIQISGQPSRFTGYENFREQTKVSRYRSLKSGKGIQYQIVLEETPFYAESGGQVGDTGWLVFGDEKIRVINTKKENDLIVHFTESLPSNISEEVIAEIDGDRRKFITAHHTATHLVHAALRKVLGTHVEQKGSLVTDTHLRFDFSHFSKMTDEEIRQVEEIVNEKIRENIPVVIKEMPKEEALKFGAMALFGEKYGDVVRVVMADPDYSVELCGGTHVGSTGELGSFYITTETAVAAGLRRIEAVSGKAATDYVISNLNLLRDAKAQFKNPKDLLKSIQLLLSENQEMRKKMESLEQQQLAALASELQANAEWINGVKFIGKQVSVSNADALKKLCYELKLKDDNSFVVLTSVIDGKAFVAIGIAEKLVKEKFLNANALIKEKVAPLIKGGGGGQNHLATAGGQNPAALDEVIKSVKATL